MARTITWKIRSASTIAFLLCLVSTTFGRQLAFRLSGEIRGIQDGKAVLTIFSYTDSEPPVRDTVSVEKGRFSFKGSVPSPMLADVRFLSSNVRFAVFLERGNISVVGDTSLRGAGELLPIHVTGSKNHAEYERVSSFKRIEIDSLYHLSLIEKNSERKTALRSKVDSLNELATANNIDFIRTHLNSAVSAYYMIFNTSDYNMSFQHLKDIVTGFGVLPRSTPYYRTIKESFDAIAKIQPGEMAPDFSLKTPDGKEFSLSRLNGKYVLLDFWASWCLPCRQSFPKMKEIYSQYHGRGFEIVGVSDDSKPEAWLKAIADDGLPWLQVIDEFPQKYKPARVGTLYAIHYLPTTLLVDRTGKIVAKNLHDEDLKNTLEGLLSK